MPLSGSFTQSYTRTLLDAITGRNLLDSPTKLQLALFTSDPGEEPDTWTELSGDGYARVDLDLGLATTPDPDNSGSGSVTNESIVSFPAATAEWSGVKFGGLVSTPELTIEVEQPGDIDANGQNVQTPILIPQSHAKVLASDVEILDINPGSSIRTVKISVPVASWNSGTYGAADILSQPHHFIRIKSGAYAGMSLMVSGDDTNEIEVWGNWHLPKECIGERFDICENPTLEEFFGEVVEGEDNVASGLLQGTSQSADLIYIEKFGSGATMWNILYAQDAPVFAGGVGWRKSGSAGSDVSTVRIPVGGVYTPASQDAGNFDSMVFMKGCEAERNGVDWTITSQLHLPMSDSVRDASLLARLRFEDANGNPINNGDGVDVPINNQLEIAVGDLVLSLD